MESQEEILTILRSVIFQIKDCFLNLKQTNRQTTPTKQFFKLFTFRTAGAEVSYHYLSSDSDWFFMQGMCNILKTVSALADYIILDVIWGAAYPI